ncbi:AGAP002008-PA-like protein [Anopheles sinensis]|uniref:AGAP002008-PA-like protein n=1 Tax=Anopheles sinensis TaxID=74873 RepID=A0A084VHD7_ANOSI|nr:AGAP002008-PA-like protein [Anopheles sinensis]
METDRKIKFLTTELVQKIIQSNDDLKEYQLAKENGVSLTTPQGLDGFMSIIHRLRLNLQHTDTGMSKTVTVMVKVMKGDDDFRKKSLGLVLFPNEINVYGCVIPAFEQLVRNSGAQLDFKTLCPRIFLAEAGVRYPAYSDQEETFLVMEDVSASGFIPGPRLNLDQAHLRLMARKIAQFHACSYALRIGGQSDRLRALVERIIPLNFIQDGKIFFESYDVVFKVVFERLFKYLEGKPELLGSDFVRDRIRKLKQRYGTTPSELMQRCLSRDETYSVILHGDYNRNNVLFRYENEVPNDVMLIDFQENRYGSPALDLSFFMYMNMPPEAWENGAWEQLLTLYHEELMRCICELLKLPPNHSSLEPYRFEKMKQHLQQHFIYGAIIAIKFLPCMLSSEAEVAEIVHHFHTDVTADAFRQIYLVAGGQVVNDRISKVIVHAAEQGYLDLLDN